MGPIDDKSALLHLLGNRQQAITWFIDGSGHWCIYASAGISELTHCGLGDFNEILDEYFFKPITMIDGWDIFCEIARRRMSLDLNDDKSTLVQVMAWWRQASSHYLSQCWPSSLTPYDITRPQWVNLRCAETCKSSNPLIGHLFKNNAS